MGVKTTLKLAGTNVKTFEAHSTAQIRLLRLMQQDLL